MLERLTHSYSEPANAQRYNLAALLIATAAFAFIGGANAVDAPEPGSVYEKEDAFGILLVIGQTLPLALALRFPMAALFVIMGSFTVHAGLDYDAILVVQFSALFSFFIAVIRGGNRQSYLALLVIYIASSFHSAFCSMMAKWGTSWLRFCFSAESGSSVICSVLEKFGSSRQNKWY